MAALRKAALSSARSAVARNAQSFVKVALGHGIASASGCRSTGVRIGLCGTWMRFVGTDEEPGANRRRVDARHFACAAPSARPVAGHQADSSCRRPDFLEVGVDHVVLLRLGLPAPAGSRVAALLALYMASPSFIEACARSLVLALIASMSSPSSAVLQRGDRRLDRALVGRRDLVAELLQRLLGRVDRALRRGSWRRPVRGASCPRRRAASASFTIFSMSASLTGRPKPGCGSAAPCWSPCPSPRR